MRNAGDCEWTHTAYSLISDNNVEVSDGLLKLSVKKAAETYSGEMGEDVPQCNFFIGDSFSITSNYTEGTVQSQFAQNYGIFEARLKLPAAQGLWPSFWLWHHEEIDIFEFFGNTGELSTNLHRDGQTNPAGYPVSSDFTDDFHIFTLEWTPYRIIWKIDGEILRVVTKYKSVDTGTDLNVDCGDVIPAGHYYIDPVFPRNIPIRYMSLILGGGIYPENFDNDSALPQTMLIDYVKIYGRVTDEFACDEITFTGPEEICVGNRATFEISELASNPVNVSWTTSPNLQLTLTTDDKTDIIVKPYSTDNTGWIQVRVNVASVHCNNAPIVRRKSISINGMSGSPTKPVYIGGFVNNACAGSKMILKAIGSQNADSYHWNVDGANIAWGQGERSILIETPNQFSYIDVEVRAENDCGVSDYKTISGQTRNCPSGGSCAAVFRLSPNPAQNHINVKFENDLIDLEPVLSLPSTYHTEIYSPHNGVVKVVPSEQPNLLIDISDIPEGVYYIKAKTIYCLQPTVKVFTVIKGGVFSR